MPNKTGTDGISIIDDFLPQETFVKIQNGMMSNLFPWYFSPFKTYFDADGGVFDSQLNHTFFFDNQWNSPNMWAVEPILTILNPSKILRIKANLTMPQSSVGTVGMHTDFDDPEVTTAIFYLVDCDGGTVFETGEVVASVPNRLVSFPATVSHSAQTFTNAKARCVINFNFVL